MLECSRRARPITIYWAAPVDFEGPEVSRCGGIARALVRWLGLEVIDDLSTASDLATDRNTLLFAKWDQHTTALGHRLLADNCTKSSGRCCLAFMANSCQARPRDAFHIQF